MNVVRTLELCAGVGMLSEGIHAGLRHLGFAPRAVGYCERDAYAAAVLLARMEAQAVEPAPVWAGNLQDVRWESFAGAVDCIAAGFPCQPHSMAGSRKGTDDERWIWPAIADCIRVVRPWLVVLENVAGIRSSGGLAPVLADLAALGFRVEWDSIRASDVGASHQRERAFIVGYAERARRAPTGRGLVQHSRREPEPGCGEMDHSAGARRNGARQRTEADQQGGQCVPCAGCADVGYAGLQHQHVQQWPHGAEHPRAGRELADASEPGQQGRELGNACNADREGQEAHGSVAELCSLFAPGPSDQRWPGIIAERPDLAPATAKSDVRGMADGLASGMDDCRADRLRCVGNGVVALQAGLAVVVLARRLGI